jgi:23S rRNA U2552 (ribose-2'-O)-methylase RlmE/FtsJ
MNIELLEIGIGTNSPGLVSTMGKNAKPGASLRAFVEFDSRINVIGADIDRKILFSSDRINCFYIDQKNLESYYELSKFSRISKFDLIIDDGLHKFEANINLFENSFKFLSKEGIYIIEDVYSKDKKKFLDYLKKNNYNFSIVDIFHPNNISNNSIVKIYNQLPITVQFSYP